jgi:hypothetical protein
LFNTLNTVTALIRATDEASGVLKLSASCGVARKYENLAPGDELDFIEDYLAS